MTNPITIEPALQEVLTEAWCLAVPQVLGKRATVELWDLTAASPVTRDLEDIALGRRVERLALLERFTAICGIALPTLHDALLQLSTQVEIWWLQRTTAPPASRLLPEDARPVLHIEADMAPPTDALERLLLAAPDVALYQRGGALCEIRPSGPTPKFLHRPLDLPRIAPVTAPRVRELASHVARFDLVHAGSGKITRDLPPQWVIDTLIARGTWDFPPLEGIVNVPTLRPDGTLLTQEGYDDATGLYLAYNHVVFPEVHPTPTKAEALDAKDLLWEVFQDFPYTEPAVGFSATLAALLSCVCRHAILGRIPMFVVRSTTRASGKGKLIDAISLIALGRTAPRMAQTMDEEEERKRLLAIALAAIPLLHIDNVAHPLGSGVLDYALTSPTIGDRVLGKSEDAEAPLNTVFFASGNNVMFKGDTVRRVIPLDLDPRVEHPELRENFLHADLETWVTHQRPSLVHACLTIMRGFFAAHEAHKALPAFGSYEAWSRLIRQAITWLGAPDPCQARLDLESTSEPLHEARDELLTQWICCYPGILTTQPRSVQSILADIASHTSDTSRPRGEWDAFRDALGALTMRYDGHHLQARAVGDALRAMKRVVIGDRRIADAPKRDRRGAILWYVESFQPLSVHSQHSQEESISLLREEKLKNVVIHKNIDPYGEGLKPSMPDYADYADRDTGPTFQWCETHAGVELTLTPQGWGCVLCLSQQQGAP